MTKKILSAAELSDELSVKNDYINAEYMRFLRVG